MKPVKKSGASIALAVAAVVIAISAPGGPSYAEEEKGRCMGANAVKGQSACSTNGCSGTNACKGQGFLEMTKTECDKIPGTTFEPEKPD